eukprot:2268285-Pyramimonas_sp.AAC.1
MEFAKLRFGLAPRETGWRQAAILVGHGPRRAARFQGPMTRSVLPASHHLYRSQGGGEEEDIGPNDVADDEGTLGGMKPNTTC